MRPSREALRFRKQRLANRLDIVRENELLCFSSRTKINRISRKSLLLKNSFYGYLTWSWKQTQKEKKTKNNPASKSVKRSRSIFLKLLIWAHLRHRVGIADGSNPPSQPKAWNSYCRPFSIFISEQHTMLPVDSQKHRTSSHDAGFPGLPTMTSWRRVGSLL